MDRKGEPTEHFIDLLPMKRTDAESIYSALVQCLKSKNTQLSNLIGMGFDGAATFSGKKSGVQARMKKHSPHALLTLGTHAPEGYGSCPVCVSVRNLNLGTGASRGLNEGTSE